MRFTNVQEWVVWASWDISGTLTSKPNFKIQSFPEVKVSLLCKALGKVHDVEIKVELFSGRNASEKEMKMQIAI